MTKHSVSRIKRKYRPFLTNKKARDKKKKYYQALILFIIVITILIFITIFLQKKDTNIFSTNINPISFSNSINLPFENEDYKVSQKKSMFYKVLTEQIGKPYKYGDVGPDSFDCSGLAQFAFSKIGIKLPRVAADQATVGTVINKTDLKFGDIVFFAKEGSDINHEGIYLANGKMIHAPQTGDVISISSIDSGYYEKTFKKAVRVLN